LLEFELATSGWKSCGTRKLRTPFLTLSDT
jgi:hypothetical protein